MNVVLQGFLYAAVFPPDGRNKRSRTVALGRGEKHFEGCFPQYSLRSHRSKTFNIVFLDSFIVSLFNEETENAENLSQYQS